jgi:iron only hydrogenase large subunit-like protein
MACPGGCYSGGGQPKLESIKPKEVAEKCSQLSAHLTNPKHFSLNETLRDREREFSAGYKVIEKTLTQAVMNW